MEEPAVPFPFRDGVSADNVGYRQPTTQTARSRFQSSLAGGKARLGRPAPQTDVRTTTARMCIVRACVSFSAELEPELALKEIHDLKSYWQYIRLEHNSVLLHIS